MGGLTMVFVFEQVLHAKFDPMALQEIDVLVLKRSRFVMFFLIADVVPNQVNSIVADRKSSIALLPFEITLTNFIRHPFRRVCFDITNHFGHRDRWRQTCKNVNVIVHTADLNQVPLLPSNRSPDVLVETLLQIFADCSSAVLCSEDDVVGQACEAAHGVPQLLSPLRGS